MKIYITFGAVLLVLTAVATSCRTVGSKRADADKVYLVGVAGGG